ncbi:HesB/IscA family protein [Salinicola rhizosphaerae]|uniref:Iron-binding protein IscA n=1 Tax=Salinicola rhizosphaerae TaxID=1443141 RepID=A0ABQ3E443_9GAMM|nr:iron-sulfur cluster assembly accessory protein [Salinicola rhizosphaerae]GHB22654.1 iron-binding protein IscA [Salinicola rhizosphaerae]
MQNITISEAAADQIQQVLKERGSGLGLRVAVKPSGCSGFSYVLDIADELQESDVAFEARGVKVLVDREALEILDGTEVDYVSEGLNRFFRFNNPNVTDECGCGESFNV